MVTSHFRNKNDTLFALYPRLQITMSLNTREGHDWTPKLNCCIKISEYSSLVCIKRNLQMLHVCAFKLMGTQIGIYLILIQWIKEDSTTVVKKDWLISYLLEHVIFQISSSKKSVFSLLKESSTFSKNIRPQSTP